MPDVPVVVLWRAFVPRWAYQPLSGQGAALFGGRWNPVGAATIYAARELSTAWAEYNQGFVQHPALIARLELSDAMLADLTDRKVLQALGVGEEIHDCQWRADLDRGETPATHRVRETLIGQGYDGVVYPSFMSPGGSCVAVRRWNGPGEPSLRVIDPEGRLPNSPASWL
jgi:RES domain-containing protein